MSVTAAPATSRLLTIGSVCARLKDEFRDISISKIRYLEDQGLLSLRRTQGGYRLFSEEDVERLETILRLQRDEFLPLRVIRQELASPVAKERRRKRAVGLTESEDEIDLGELPDRLPECLGVEEKRGDVLEPDSRLRKVRHLADARRQIYQGHAARLLDQVANLAL